MFLAVEIWLQLWQTSEMSAADHTCIMHTIYHYCVALMWYVFFLDAIRVGWQTDPWMITSNWLPSCIAHMYEGKIGGHKKLVAHNKWNLYDGTPVCIQHERVKVLARQSDMTWRHCHDAGLNENIEIWWATAILPRTSDYGHSCCMQEVQMSSAHCNFFRANVIRVKIHKVNRASGELCWYH